MTKNPNGRNLRGWITLALALAVIFATICVAWGGQMKTVADNKARSEKTETVQTKILQSLARIEGKLDITQKAQTVELKEIEP